MKRVHQVWIVGMQKHPRAGTPEHMLLAEDGELRGRHSAGDRHTTVLPCAIQHMVKYMRRPIGLGKELNRFANTAWIQMIDVPAGEFTSRRPQ